jgi:hypothetical protein
MKFILLVTVLAAAGRNIPAQHFPASPLPVVAAGRTNGIV